MSDVKPRGAFQAVEIGKLAGLLNERALSLAERLLPGGEKRGRFYSAARRADGGLGDSLKVNVETGKWVHYGDVDAKGDMLDLIQYVTRKDKREAIEEALKFLGMKAGDAQLAVSDEAAAVARQAAAAAKAQRVERVKSARAAARAIFFKASPLTMDDPAGRYLFGRGIDLGKLFRHGYGLRALRYTPALRHPIAGREFPAMVALCTFSDGEVATLHRTYLVERKQGEWDRLRTDVDRLEGKMLYTDIDGAICKLWRGERIDRGTGEVKVGYPWAHDDSGPSLVLCEGIENALSLAVARPGRRIGAAISLGNFSIVKLPPRFTDVTWFADDDGDNEKAHRLLDQALARLEEQNRTVRVGRPPAGAKDANDVLKGAAA